MVILWILLGLFATAVPFWLFNVPMNPWSAVNASGIGAALFTVIFFVAVLRDPAFSRKARTYASLFYVLIAASIAISWKTSYDQSHYQRTRIGEIRTVIGEGILKSYSTQTELKALRAYYLQKAGHGMPIGTVFLQVNKDYIKDGLLMYEDTRFHIMYLADQPRSVVTLLSVDSVARGRDEHFKNANGQTGRLQMRVSLTEKGVRHEREN